MRLSAALLGLFAAVTAIEASHVEAVEPYQNGYAGPYQNGYAEPYQNGYAEPYQNGRQTFADIVSGWLVNHINSFPSVVENIANNFEHTESIIFHERGMRRIERLNEVYRIAKFIAPMIEMERLSLTDELDNKAVCDWLLALAGDLRACLLDSFAWTPLNVRSLRAWVFRFDVLNVALAPLGLTLEFDDPFGKDSRLLSNVLYHGQLFDAFYNLQHEWETDEELEIIGNTLSSVITSQHFMQARYPPAQDIQIPGI